MKKGLHNPWTLEELKHGFLEFYKIHGRYPTSNEVDNFDLLPTSRSIQRSFGGLVEVRKKLGLDEHLLNLTKGGVRSTKAKELWENARNYEEEFYHFLISKIPEMRVHEHKIILPGRIASDFFIYYARTISAESGKTGVVIDLFWAQDLHSVKGVVSTKIKLYAPLKDYKIYYILIA